MKKSRFLALILALCMAFALFAAAGCTDGDSGDDGKPTPLGKPNVTLNDNVLSWGEITNADGYNVYKESEKVAEKGKTECSYTITGGVAGETYNYYVEAFSNDPAYSSAKSQAVPYTVPGNSDEPGEDTSVKLTGKIYLVGDSTVCNYDPLDDAYLPRYGYGMELHNFINCDANQIVNLALSGRSSLSFISEPNYNTLKSSISEGDYLIIGFGHNDEKTTAGYFTTTKKDYTDATTENGVSFQYSLYHNYVDLAKQKNATAILCTPIVRYDSGNKYSKSDKVHITSDGDYSAAIRTLASATNTALVDLTELTKELYMADNKFATNFHCHSTYEEVEGSKVPPAARASITTRWRSGRGGTSSTWRCRSSGRAWT